MNTYPGAQEEKDGASASFSHIAGTGKFAPGIYKDVKIDFITNYDTNAVVRLSTPDGTYHLESVLDWPSWWYEGGVFQIEVGLSEGVVLVKVGSKYRAIESLTGKELVPWTSSLTPIVDKVTKYSWKLASPTLKRIWTHDKSYTFTKAKSLPSSDATSILKREGGG